jgi:hypothetical protein
LALSQAPMIADLGALCYCVRRSSDDGCLEDFARGDRTDVRHHLAIRRAWHVTLLSMQTSSLTVAEQASPAIIVDKPSFVFLVIHDRFGVVSASLDEEEAVIDLKERVLAQDAPGGASQSRFVSSQSHAAPSAAQSAPSGRSFRLLTHSQAAARDRWNRSCLSLGNGAVASPD